MISPSLAGSVLETIGRTPMVALDRLGAGLPGRVLVKLEYFTPGFSIKDRIALYMIEDAERDGRLLPGGRVVELTSGNTGTGLAIVCAVKGYRFIAVMSEGNSPERAAMMQAMGAQVVLVPQVGGPRPGFVSGADLAEVERRAQEITRRYRAFRADQFNNASNARAHELTTGREIWEQAGGRVDSFVSTLGTGGTFAGISAALKRRQPDVRCFAVEPAGAPFLAKGKVTNPNHKIQGAGYALPLPLVAPDLVDAYLTVTDESAVRMARQLARKEGIFAGFSSGANVAAALRLARRAEPGSVIVTTVNDSGLKYLSTGLFSPQGHSRRTNA